TMPPDCVCSAVVARTSGSLPYRSEPTRPTNRTTTHPAAAPATRPDAARVSLEGMMPVVHSNTSVAAAGSEASTTKVNGVIDLWDRPRTTDAAIAAAAAPA